MADGFGTRRVGISAVWDDAVQVLRGRAGRVASIALLAFVLPPALQGAARLLVRPGTPAAALLVLMLGLLVLLASLWGALAILSLSSDPSVTPERARAAGARRTPAALGVGLVLGLAAGLLGVPLVAALVRAGFDVTAAARGAAPATMPSVTAGAGLFLLLYSLAFAALLLWAGARLATVYAVVLHERLGLGAIGRAFRLTRGMGGRLVALELLFAVVLLVATYAAQEVVFVPLRLLLGAGGLAVATFLAALAGSCVSAALTSLAYVFVARLYAALVGRESAGYADRA